MRPRMGSKFSSVDAPGGVRLAFFFFVGMARLRAREDVVWWMR
jgi:hypothetical protein